MSCRSDGAAEPIGTPPSSCTQRDPVEVQTSTHFAPDMAINSRDTEGATAMPSTAKIAMRAKQLK